MRAKSSSDDTLLKLPASLGQAAKLMTNPKPDVMFGSWLNRKEMMSTIHGDNQDSIFHLDQDWLARLTRRDFAEISSGAASQLFCFPTFTIERKSDSGSSYVAQNQLLGSLLCIYESMKVSHLHIDKNLPVMALGLVNVGNWVELWGLWPGTNVLPYSII